MSQTDRRPNIGVFVIGAARSGTTSIFRALSAHPRFFVPGQKEPRFFDQNWDKGWGWYASRVQEHIGIPACEVRALGFPRANASERKKNRPGAPLVSPEDRARFQELVEDDAGQFLDRRGLPRVLWPLSPQSPAWEAARLREAES